MLLGARSLRFTETMEGTYRPTEDGAPERGFHFTASARARSLPRFLRDATFELEGAVTMEGYEECRPLRGTLSIRLLRDRTLRYAFTFPAKDGRVLRFEGKKTVVPWRPLRTMTVLRGAVYDGDVKIADARLHFDIKRELLPMLFSVRMRLAA